MITDEDACARAGRGLIETLALALLPDARGVAVLLRAPGRSLDEVRSLCTAVLPIARRAGALLLVHTHVELVALGLDGAHLDSRADAHALARARASVGATRALLGASRHDGDALVDPSLDYVTLSPIFAPSSKPDDTRAPLGVAALARKGVLPLVALGGIDDRRAGACVRAGASAVAVLGAVMQAHDPRRSLTALLRA